MHLLRLLQVLYTGAAGLCAHEFILDLRDFKASPT